MWKPSIYTHNYSRTGWLDYARFVLYHEYLHALGNRFHDAHFRNLELQWPHSGADRGRNLPFIFVSELQLGYGFVLRVKRNTLDERNRMGVSDVVPCSTILTDVPNMQETN